MPLTELITILRQKSLLSQEQFAKEIGVASSTVNRWETGKARPNMNAMRAIKEFCELHSYFFTDIEDAWIDASKKK